MRCAVFQPFGFLASCAHPFSGGARLSKRLSVLFVTVMALGSSAFGQILMNDGSAVYDNYWSDTRTVYAFGATYGYVSVHTYAVDVSITSPAGRWENYTKPLIGGYVSTDATLDVDYSEDGDYLIHITHRGYCSAVMTAFVLAELFTRTKPPTQYCKDGTTVSSCADSNSLAPIGRMKSSTCKYYDACCRAGGDAAPGWCRKETCNKCGGQKIDPAPSQCQSETACKAAFSSLCGGAC